MAFRQLGIPLKRSFEPGQKICCLECLQRRLGADDGIVSMEIEADGSRPGVLKLNYDPRLITLSDLEARIANAGACFSGERVQRVLSVTGMVSPSMEKKIEAELATLPSVAASASFASRTVRVEFDREHCEFPKIIRKLESMGLHVRDDARVEPAAPAVASKEPGTVRKFVHDYPWFALAILGGALVLASFLVEKFQGPLWARLALVIPAYILCGWSNARDTLKTLLSFRFDVDVLMFAAALGACVLGHFEEGALLLFLFAIGSQGEEMAMDKARHAIQALAKLAPETAIRRASDGTESVVKIDALAVNDVVVCRPYDRIPCDGAVLAGASAVDQSPITGESVPAEKITGDPVFAGTINGDGLLLVNVTRLASQSTLARVIRMVNEAQTAKSPTQVFTDRVERWYVPIVLIATAALVFIPPLVSGGAWKAWETWFYRAMAFLTAASPCALAIGTPAAVLSGIARAARAGVLIKGGVHLENLGRVRVIAFDKTGTLTRGKPELVSIVPLGDMSEPDILKLAASVEKNSSHPLARAIAAEATARSYWLDDVDSLEQVPARGMRAMVDGRRVSVGHLSLLPENAPNLDEARQAIARLSEQGRTTVVLGVDGRAEAVLGLADRPRDNANAALADLKSLGIERTVMLTGDHRTVAAAMAKEIGVDQFYGDLLPEDKVGLVRKLTEEYGHVAMVGDGVNDAPAMAGASVGIAMGGAGTDVALETADVALMADDLGKLPEAIGLSRMSRRIIAQNLTIALGVIAVVAPIAALGGATLTVAVLLHEGSTVVVVCNSLRLLFYRNRRRRAAAE